MTETQADHRLYGVAGWGSVLVEAALVRARLPYTFEDVAGFDEPGPARDRLLTVNSLAQVPALVLRDDTAMKERAAILLHLAETYPEAGLAPPGRAAASPCLSSQADLARDQRLWNLRIRRLS